MPTSGFGKTDYNGRTDDLILSVTRGPICLAHSAVLFRGWSEYHYVRLGKPIEPPRERANAKYGKWSIRPRPSESPQAKPGLILRMPS